MPKRLSILVFALLAITASWPATAGAHGRHAHVTRGSVITLPGGMDLGYELDGHAVMVRTRHSTRVQVHVRGLDAETTYPTHVHNAPCSATPPGGSHYQHEIGGPVDPVNEIWPTITTNRHGNGSGHATHDQRARPDAMSIVIHYPADTSIRLACIDLS